MSIIIEYEIPIEDISRLTADYNRQAQKKLIGAVSEILTAIEEAQILKYTGTTDPPLPAGSRYVRSFALRETSQKEIKSRDLPEITGEWSTTGAAAYDRYVLGPREDQAAIHRGRWKSTEEVEKEIEHQAEEIVLGAMEEIQV